MKNILIVDDHFLVSMGLEVLVRKVVKDCNILTAMNYAEAMGIVKKHCISLMLLDLGIPGGQGAEMIEAFIRVQKDIKILVCSGRDELHNAPVCMRAGAYGFLSKNAPDDHGKIALEMVMMGKKYISSSVQENVFNTYLFGQSIYINPLEALSPREKDVMNLLIKGKSNKEISNTLHIKHSTVSTHKLRIFQKMDVENNVELLRKIEGTPERFHGV